MKNMPDTNSQAVWDAIWQAEGDDTWRTYPRLYGRVAQLITDGSKVFDIGCGVGKLLDRLRDEKGCYGFGIDISPVAVEAARQKGHVVQACRVSADSEKTFDIPKVDFVVATEMLEHLRTHDLEWLLAKVAATGARAIFAVPNNCMGPDVEPQHHQQWTALEFKQLLEKHFKTVRVECVDDGAPRLIGVCNFPPKPYKLAFTMPVKNEGRDIERVLKSFRGAADYIVIGVDDATTDETAEVARRYADVVFSFTWENHFAKARNSCIDRCRELLDENDWIFMSEGHEHLEAGLDELLNLDQIPAGIHVLEVRREDRDHAWMFPWLFRNRREIYFENPAHNALVYEDKVCAQLPAVRTWHEPHAENRKERAYQRRHMNRQVLLEKLVANPKDERSCYYLANEWRMENPDKAIEYYQRYLAMGGKNGPERYQARLSMVACVMNRIGRRQDHIRELQQDCTNADAHGCVRREEAAQQRDMQLIYDTLIIAGADDWSRNEHWLGLGDLCASQPDRHEQAMRFYELAAVSINRAPLTFMWIEKANYTWVPAQKLVTIYAQAGMLEAALHWCEKVAELLPDWSPQEARDEVERHRQTIIEKLKEAGR